MQVAMPHHVGQDHLEAHGVDEEPNCDEQAAASAMTSVTQKKDEERQHERKNKEKKNIVQDSLRPTLAKARIE